MHSMLVCPLSVRACHNNNTPSVLKDVVFGKKFFFIYFNANIHTNYFALVDVRHGITPYIVRTLPT